MSPKIFLFDGSPVPLLFLQPVYKFPLAHETHGSEPDIRGGARYSCPHGSRDQPLQDDPLPVIRHYGYKKFMTPPLLVL
ncbi:MAG: hypothetical protein WBI18_10620 [Candidatus Saccharicenans sp.]